MEELYENKEDRKHVWKNISQQSKYGPRGRENANNIEGTI